MNLIFVVTVIIILLMIGYDVQCLEAQTKALKKNSKAIECLAKTLKDLDYSVDALQFMYDGISDKFKIQISRTEVKQEEKTAR